MTKGQPPLLRNFKPVTAKILTHESVRFDNTEKTLYRYFKTVDIFPAPSGSLSSSVSPAAIMRL